MTPPDRQPARWCDVLNPAPTSPEPPPLECAAALERAAAALVAHADPAARDVGARLRRWLDDGGDLHRVLGLRGRRGSRDVHARRIHQARVEALRAAAAATGEATPTAQAAALARLLEGDDPEAHRLRLVGVARSQRQILRVLATGVARACDTSS